jgi:hypothetical protein
LSAAQLPFVPVQ